MYQARRTLEKYGWKEGNESNKVHAAWQMMMYFRERLRKKWSWNCAFYKGSTESRYFRGMQYVCIFTITSKLFSLQIGFNPGEEFTDHWWTEQFNKTAKHITVEQSKVLWYSVHIILVYIWNHFDTINLLSVRRNYIWSVTFGKTLFL